MPRLLHFNANAATWMVLENSNPLVDLICRIARRLRSKTTKRQNPWEAVARNPWRQCHWDGEVQRVWIVFVPIHLESKCFSVSLQFSRSVFTTVDTNRNNLVQEDPFVSQFFGAQVLTIIIMWIWSGSSLREFGDAAALLSLAMPDHSAMI